MPVAETIILAVASYAILVRGVKTLSVGKGLRVPDVCKQLGISEQTYYRRRTKYGGMDPAYGQAAA